MPLYSILLIGTFVIVAGIIAYTGNWVGRRLGKQRLSLFGLRPRYTATVFTIISGMLISGVTILALTQISDKINIAMTHVEALLISHDRLKAQNENLRLEQTTLRASLKQVRELKKRSDAELAKAQAAAQVAQKRSDELTAEIQAKTAQLAVATRHLTATQADLARSRTDLAHAKVQLTGVNKQLTTAERVAIDVGNENIELYTRTHIYETGQLIYRPSQEVIRGSISVKQTPRQIQNDLTQLLARASTSARARGAAAGIAGPAVRIPDGRAMGKPYHQEQILADLAKRLAESKTDMVVRVVAMYNCVQGQQVMVDLDYRPKKIIYQKGNEIATKQFDSNQSEAQLLQQLVEVLKTKVRADALQRGIIPTSGADANADYDSVGEVSYEELLQVVQRIKKHGGPVKVRFSAAKDTWTEGPLVIDFQVIEERTVNASYLSG